MFTQTARALACEIRNPKSAIPKSSNTPRYPSWRYASRILKIEPIYTEHTTCRRTPPSYLRLKGCWLTQLGFAPGDQVEVTATAGELIIRKRPQSAT